jgi:hypothetical protein
MRSLDQHVAGMGPLDRWRLHPIDAIANLECPGIVADGSHGACDIIAEYHGKPTCP